MWWRWKSPTPTKAAIGKTRATTGSAVFRRAILGYQTGAALKGDVVPCPVDRHQEAVTKTDQKIDVRHAQKRQGEKALQLQPTKFHHRGPALNSCKISVMYIPERVRQLRSGNARGDNFCDVFAHLFGGGRDAGHWPAPLVEN